MKFFSKQYRKILFLISLPLTNDFLSCKKDIENCISKLKKMKVEVHEEINKNLLAKASNYEIVIIVAHHDVQRNALALPNGYLAIEDLINFLPENFNGTLDFSSCYSASAMKKIKSRCPNCLVQTAIVQTSLPLRLIMYPHIINLLNENRDRSYRDTYLDVLNVAAESVPEATIADKESIKLGKQQSSIYAPSNVKRNNPFMIQIFFNNDNEGRAVDIEAKRIDPQTGLIETQNLPLRLKKRDRISIRFCIISPEKESITIEDNIDIKNIIWLGHKTKVIFCATVENSFSANSFIGKLMIEVNSIPIGESYFTISVEGEKIDHPAEVQLKAHDFKTEQHQAKKALIEKLSANLLNLQEKLQFAKNEHERKKLNDSLRICSSCIELIENETQRQHNSVKKVFVSSTSDMKPYREIVRKEIEACNMYPEMYENWPQSDSTPKDECCRRVIASDILFCILGSRYGFIDPTLGMSMTEIEYRTALEAGKIILVCIIEPLEKSNEPEEISSRQKELIEEIRNTRILKFFTDSATLAKDAIRNLSRLENIKL